MCKTKIINVCNETAANEIDVNEVDTDGNNKWYMVIIKVDQFLFSINSKIHSLRFRFIPYVFA